MSEENVEIVKAIFTAWKKRDAQAAEERIAPDVEIDWTRVSGIPASSGRGRERLRAVVADWRQAFDGLEFTPESFIDAGKHVIVVLNATARGRESDVPVTRRYVAVYTIGKGRVVAFRGYDTLAAAASAAGV